MNPAVLFIVAISGLQLLATVAYASAGDWRRAVFWTCAAVMNIMVTF